MKGKNMRDIIVGFLFSFLIAFAAYKKKSLSLSGTIAAILLGTSIYFFGGVYFSAIMVSFFISSSLFTKLKAAFKKGLEDINEKGGERDYIQVIANGGAGFIFAFLYYMTKNPVFLVAYGTSFAASNADTWASELGVLSKSNPISILTLKKAERGVSGAVSGLGILASLFGALFVAFVFDAGYFIKFGFNDIIVTYTIAITLSGFFGSIIDSVLGAAVQAKYKCVVCGKTTERKQHHGRECIHISGIKWINNDAVNFICSLIACLITIVFV